jgi:hypothetical protein
MRISYSPSPAGNPECHGFILDGDYFWNIPLLIQEKARKVHWLFPGLRVEYSRIPEIIPVQDEFNQ